MIERNMNCEQFELLISADMDNDLDAREAEQLGCHLLNCDSCRELQRDFRTIDSLVDGLGLIQGSTCKDQLHDSVWAAGNVRSRQIVVAKAQLIQNSTRSRFLWRALPIGVAAALLVMISILVWPTGNRAEASEAISVPMLEVAKINQQTEFDQRLMVKMLEFELRSLRLELAQVSSDPELQLILDQRLNELIERVKTFRSNMNEFHFGE